MRAFDAGWGGAVWKTLGDPIVNTSSRFGAVDCRQQRMMGFNNIELITDRPLEVEPARDPRGQEALPEARRHRLADGRDEGRLARHHPARRGRRRRRPRAQLRLPARHVRARHGLGGRPGAQGAREISPAGRTSTRRLPVLDQAHAEHRRHPRARRRGGRGRRRTGSRSSTPSRASSASISTAWSPTRVVGGARPTAATAGRR